MLIIFVLIHIFKLAVLQKKFMIVILHSHSSYRSSGEEGVGIICVGVMIGAMLLVLLIAATVNEGSGIASVCIPVSTLTVAEGD